MFTSIWTDIKREFNYGNMVTRIIIANVAVYIFVSLLYIIMTYSMGTFVGNKLVPPPLFQDIILFFSIPSHWLELLTHPWTPFTCMFLHQGFWHILWNMLFLYWFGRIVGDLLGNHRVLPLYLLGGLAGAFAFFISANLLAHVTATYALGASAAVMAIVVASGFLAPDYNIRLLFLGDVKLKYIVAALILMDLIMATGSENTGGHFGHLGGAFMGWFFIYRLREGHDMSANINNFIHKITSFFSRTKGPKVAYRNPNLKRKHAAHAVSDSDSIDRTHQEQLDEILEKIKRSGYDSLSAEEKEFLFDASKK